MLFSEIPEMVEDCLTPDIADAIIEASDLPSGGAYTAVGPYDHAEIVTLVHNLSTETGLGCDELLHAFGKHLFGRFVQAFPAFFEGQRDAFQFLQSVEDQIHVEVRKLYPDAELPSLDAIQQEPNHLKIVCRSDRSMGTLAHGLIEGCIQHFAALIEIRRSHGLADAAYRAEFDLLRAA